MQLRWTEEAEADLRAIAEYLFERTPEHAPRIVQAIYDAPASLLNFPGRGRPGKKPGTRELVLTSLPYLVVYAVTSEVIHIPYSARCAKVAVSGPYFRSLTLQNIRYRTR